MQPSSDTYVAAPTETAPAKSSRRSVIIVATLLGVAVAVVGAVLLAGSGKSSSNSDDSTTSSSSGTSVSRSADRPEGTPFVHQPHCPYLSYCKDSFHSSQAHTKQQLLMQKAREDTSSGPEASTSDQMGILDPAGLVDPNANPFVYAFQYILASLGTSILNAISSGLDVRTTFSIGLDWQALKQVYTSGDQLEEGRGKAIHAVGVVGAVTLDTSGVPAHPFTGMFKEGFDGIVRFSSAVPITRGKTQKKYILFGPEEVKTPFMVAPGLGLKATVSGGDSADLVAMWHLDGQPGEWNFFAHEFSTVVSGSKQTVLQAVAKHFQDASMCPSHITSLPFAEVTQDGNRVAHPNAPYALIFVPNAELKASFDDMVTDGYRPNEVHACDKSSQCPDVLNTLSSLPSGQALYTLYGVTGPEVQAWTGEEGRYETFDPSKAPGGVFRIGELRLTSVLSTNDQALQRSKFGDTGLFFRHRLFEDGALNAFCEHGENWIRDIRMSTVVRDRNHPTCGAGGNDDDGTDTNARQSLVCRLLFRAKTDYPDCFSKVVDLWNAGGFFPFPRPYSTFDEADWLDWCPSDERPRNSDSRDMVEQTFA